MEEFELYSRLPRLSRNMDSSSMYGPRFLLLSVAAFRRPLRDWLEQLGDYCLRWNRQEQGPLWLERSSFGLKVSQDQHSELQVVATMWRHFLDNCLCAAHAGTHSSVFVRFFFFFFFMAVNI